MTRARLDEFIGMLSNPEDSWILCQLLDELDVEVTVDAEGQSAQSMEPATTRG